MSVTKRGFLQHHQGHRILPELVQSHESQQSRQQASHSEPRYRILPYWTRQYPRLDGGTKHPVLLRNYHP